MPKVRPLPPRNAASPSGPLVVALAYDGLCTFEFGVAVEVFALPRPELGPGWYRFAVASLEKGPLSAAGGIRVQADGGLALLRRADLVVIPGWRHIQAPVPPRLVRALQAAHRRGARIMSLCSGVAVIAATGLLDGRRATTHWRYVDDMRDMYPSITLAPDVLYVDEGSVLTAAGSAAGVDLCLYVIRRDFGAKAANSVARRLVVPPHREGGQAQFIAAPVPRQRDGGQLGPLLDWVRANLDKDLSIAHLARRARMSSRTLQRRVEQATGMAIGQWILGERLRAAKDMLEAPKPLHLDDIAAACGFGSVGTLRHHFRRKIGVSPSSYRLQFSAR